MPSLIHEMLVEEESLSQAKKASHLNRLIKGKSIQKHFIIPLWLPEIRSFAIEDFVNRKNFVILVHSLIISKVDYCNSLFIWLPNVILKKVQSVLNRAARLIFNLPRRAPTTSSLIELHWLPLKARIEFKICLITFKALKFNQPSYIRELLSFSSHESTLGLRSANDPYRLHEPRAIGERGFANRSFSYIAPRLYNKLPITVKLTHSLNTFESHLKVFLFSRAYDQSGLTVQEDYAL